MQYIVPTLDLADVDEITSRRHDTEFQLHICSEMMKQNAVLPFPFHRAVILLSKEKRHAEALAICLYVERWCLGAERDHDGWSAKVWLSPKLQDVVARRAKLEAMVSRQNEGSSLPPPP